MDKKGLTLDSLYPAIISIMLIGIIIGIGIFVLSSTGDAISSTVITVTNETVTNVVEVPQSVSTISECGADNFLVQNIHNETGAVEFLAANYTFTTAGALSFSGGLGGEEANNSDWNITYTYDGASDTATTSACGVLDTTGTGIGGMASWIAVIVVVIAAAIVLGLVISSFGGGREAV